MAEIRFAVIGINHAHIYGQVDCLLRAGGKFVGFHAPEDDLAKAFGERYPQARRVADRRDFSRIRASRLILSAAIPCRSRAARHRGHASRQGLYEDKPGMTTLEQLAEVRHVRPRQAHLFRLLLRAFRDALHREGRRTGHGRRHRQGDQHRRARSAQVEEPAGGPPVVLRTREVRRHPVPTSPRISASSSCFSPTPRSQRWSPRRSPTAPTRTARASGFRRDAVAGRRGHRLRPRRLVHARWPARLGRRASRDPRHEGYIELRKYIDIGGKRRQATTCCLSTARGCTASIAPDVELPYGRQLLADIRDRTETAMPQARCFEAMELALTAQAMAEARG